MLQQQKSMEVYSSLSDRCKTNLTVCLPINKDISIPTYQWLSGSSSVLGQQKVCEELPYYLKKMNVTLRFCKK